MQIIHTIMKVVSSLITVTHAQFHCI